MRKKRHTIHGTRAAARRRVRALGRSSIYTRGGRPPLPRCDSHKWGDPEIVVTPGRPAACPCPSRDQPDPACPYVTRRHTVVRRIAAGGFAVRLDDAAESVADEVVDLGGGIVEALSIAGARDVEESEVDHDDVDEDPDLLGGTVVGPLGERRDR